jgi:hypothetical protein
MKTSLKIFGIMLLLAIGSGGCASAPKSIDPNYAAYQQAKVAQPALVEITWSDDGQRIQTLRVNAPMDIQQKTPDAPHPAWSVVNSLVRVGGIVGGIWAGGQALEGVIEAGNGATSISGSYNQPGGHMASGNVEVPTTITTTTETTSTETTGLLRPE